MSEDSKLDTGPVSIGTIVGCLAGVFAMASAAACAHEPRAVATTTDASASASSTSAKTSAPAAATASASDVARGSTVKIPLDGFVRTCNGRPKITVADADGGTRVVNQALPGKGMYFLDDEFIGYGGCDVVVCTGVAEGSVDLVDYEAAGTRAVPAGRGSSGKAPVFHVVPLAGKLDVTIDYFADASCTEPKSVTTSFVAR